MATGGKNLRDQGYPSSYSSSSSGTGLNLSQKGYPDSKSGGTVAKTTTNNGVRKLSGSTGSGATTATAAAATDGSYMADAYNALLSAYGSRQSEYENYLAQMRQAAQDAYDRGMNALNNAYDKQMSSLSDNLNSTKGQLLDSFNRSKSNINSDAESSLRQAYINRMISERNLGQQMSALGLNGGATESTLANMANNYGNARNNINTTLNKNLSNLEGNYNDNLAQAQQAYNSAVANAELQKAQQAMALENALANNQISAMSDYQSMLSANNDQYLDLLKTAVANGAKFNYDPTKAINAVKGVSVQQAAPMTANTNYAVLQALANAQQAPAATELSVSNPSIANNYLNAILKQLA